MSKRKRSSTRSANGPLAFAIAVAVAVAAAAAVACYAFLAAYGTPEQRLAELRRYESITRAECDGVLARAETERSRVEAEHEREMERMKRERTEFQWSETEKHAAANHAREMAAKTRQHEQELKRLAMDHELRYKLVHTETEARLIESTAQIPREVETRTFLTTTKKYYGPVALGSLTTPLGLASDGAERRDRSGPSVLSDRPHNNGDLSRAPRARERTEASKRREGQNDEVNGAREGAGARGLETME